MPTETEIERCVLDAVASYHQEILNFTKDLITIPTENPPGRSYRECACLIEAKLKEFGLTVDVLEVPASIVQSDQVAAPAVGSESRCGYGVRSSYGSGLRTLYFHGHYDVVPASSPEQWVPVVEGDRLFGRGSADMKGGLAAMIYAIKVIKDCGVGIKGKIGLTIVPDEETGGQRGSAYLARSGALGKDGIGALTAEPTGGVIWNACRGAISLRVRVKGRAAHVALNDRGVNAFERMLVVANALMNLKRSVESRKTTFKIQPDAARRSILLIGGRCEGGAGFNAVPAECSFTVDRRINPEEDLESEKETLMALFETLRREGIDLEVEILQEGRSVAFSEDNPLARALANSVRSVSGTRPAFELCPGLLDIRFYADQNVPAFAYGPGLLSVSHGPGEFVSLHEVYNATAVYALTAIELLG